MSLGRESFGEEATELEVGDRRGGAEHRVGPISIGCQREVFDLGQRGHSGSSLTGDADVEVEVEVEVDDTQPL